MIAFIIIASCTLLGALGVLFAPRTSWAFFAFFLFLLGALLGAWWLHAPLLALMVLVWGLAAGWLLRKRAFAELPEEESSDRRYWGGLVSVLFSLAAYRIVIDRPSPWGQENYGTSYLTQDFGGKNFFLEALGTLWSPFGLALGVALLTLAWLSWTAWRGNAKQGEV